MSKETLIDIKTKYDGTGANQAKADVASLTGQSTSGMRQESAGMHQVKKKADDLTHSTKELNKTKTTLNVITNVLRGNFIEAGKSMQQLGGAFKGLAAAAATIASVIGIVVLALNTLITKWKEHKAALEETQKQMEKMRLDRFQEVLNLNFDKSRTALSGWVDDLKKAEVQANATAAAIVLIDTAKNDAEMARIDMEEARGGVTPQEAAAMRLDLTRNRDMAKVNADEESARKKIAEQRGVSASAGEQLGKLKNPAETNKAALAAQIESLKKAGILDERGVKDLQLIAEKNGEIPDNVRERLNMMTSEKAQEKADAEALSNTQEMIKTNPYVDPTNFRIAEQGRLRKQYSESYQGGVDRVIGLASRTGIMNRALTERGPALEAQQASADAQVQEQEAVLQTIAPRRAAVSDRYFAGVLKNTPDPSTLSLSPDSARQRLISGLSPSGRFDTSGQLVDGSRNAQLSRGVTLIDQAQGAIEKGGDSDAIAAKLAQLLGKLGIKISTDRETFKTLVDQLDGVIDQLGQVNSRTKANKAGE